MEAASRLLAGPHDATPAAGVPAIAPAAFRLAIERSLLPVFGVLLGLAAVNLSLAARFPATTASPEEIDRGELHAEG
jgi:hypothetical protein